MTIKDPITVEGKVYSEYAVFLSSAPIVNGADYKTAVNLTYVPMRVDEGTNEIVLLQSHSKTKAWADIVASGDGAALQAFGTINAAVQAYLDSNG